MSETTGKLMFQCLRCGASFANPGDFFLHLDEHTENRGRAMGEEKAMAEHTPGPWEAIDQWETRGMLVWSPRIGKTVAVCDSMEVPEFERQANARLMAAAPDQNAALIALCREFEQVVAVPTAFTAYNDAQAAIAKATGGTS